MDLFEKKTTTNLSIIPGVRGQWDEQMFDLLLEWIYLVTNS